MAPTPSDYTPLLWLGLSLFIYRTVTTQIRRLEFIHRREVYHDAVVDFLAEWEGDREGDGGVEEEEIADANSDDGQRDGSAARAKVMEPENGISLEILETLATSPTYDIREAAIKILATRFTGSVRNLNSLCATLWHTDPITPAHQEAQAVLDLLRRYQLVEDSATRTKSFGFGERGCRVFVTDGNVSVGPRRREQGVIDPEEIEGPLGRLMAAFIAAAQAGRQDIVAEVE